MAGIRVRKIQFLSQGFADVLTSAGVDGAVASAARTSAQEKEGETGVPYEIRKDESWDGRSAYLAKPAGEDSPHSDQDDSGAARRSSLTHEEWMRDVWPRVGGPKWRPHS